jgi:hypothetical protein
MSGRWSRGSRNARLLRIQKINADASGMDERATNAIFIDFRFCRSSHYPGVKSPGTSCQCSSYLQRFVPSPASFLFFTCINIFLFSPARKLRCKFHSTNVFSRSPASAGKLCRSPESRIGACATTSTRSSARRSRQQYLQQHRRCAKRSVRTLGLRTTPPTDHRVFFLLKILFRPHEGYDAFVLFNACYLQRKS